MPERDMDALANEAQQLADEMRPCLAGRPPQVVGYVLADLLATWLAGHVIVDDPQETGRLREELLREHINVVRQILPIEAARIHGN